MAFDTQTFRTRTLSAIVFAVIMLAGLLWNKWSFIILFTLVHFGCWYEFIGLMKKIDPVNYKLRSLLGLFYITLPIVLIILMRVNDFNDLSDNYLKVIPCGIVFSIWINDTMAYIVGSFIGKTPLSSISPKKTREGTFGGIILCVMVITLIGYLTRFYFVADWIVISLFCAVFGTLGDLLESKLKRLASVKDSGSLMPGHGGFLDRFDSMLVAIPFVFVYYSIFIR
ncbi:MAG: phosphatidate cytidylyltransferase [Bacteroidota bacterium]|nr:phosphatidate cytidylyltransferase [Bacteroidota bacterium]